MAKVGEILSYMGSTSLGVIAGKAQRKEDGAEDVWIKPICGSDRWMNPVDGKQWLVGEAQLRKVSALEQELARLLFETKV